jgi:hypothetical protein
LQQVRSLWDRIRSRVEEQAKPLRGPLSRATVDALEGGALTISVPDEMQESLLRPRLSLVEGAVADAIRSPLRLVLRSRSTRGGETYRAAVAAGPEAGAESDETAGGEIDLMAYARKKFGGTESS